MYQGMYHTTRTYNGKQILIDLAMFPDGSAFEVAVLDCRTSEEYDIREFSQLGDAIAYYNRMLGEYPADQPKTACLPPLTGKYARLRDDLRAAWENTPNSAEDGGTCNMDCPVLYLPRWTRSKVEQAGKEAGIPVHFWRSGCYHIGVASACQGDARTAKAEAMSAHLKAAGYDTSVWYCID